MGGSNLVILRTLTRRVSRKRQLSFRLGAPDDRLYRVYEKPPERCGKPRAPITVAVKRQKLGLICLPCSNSEGVAFILVISVFCSE